MNDMEKLPIKRTFLQSLIASVGISAFLGILAILIGNFGEFEIKVLLTTLTISGASLCGLCCGAAIELRGQRVLPFAGILSAIIAAVMIIIGMWGELDSEAFWKSTATVSIFAVAFSHLSLLMLARLSAKYAWAMPAAYGLVALVAFWLAGMLWGEWDGEMMFRMLGVAAVLDGAITILIPIFHRLSHEDFQASSDSALEDIDREIARLENRLRELKTQREAMATKQAG
jgi:hypothetical protein